ncbi:MAG: 30S ribosomal protein S16 [Chloroflexi bacterium]|nr:30S ribosomal protein S16 [Chloroflexota bacterium]MDL1884495.1 30S ribosomal protein S16 [Anaerolineae bacterium CFX8]
MVRIRLRRVGLKKQPSYRIVVVNQRTARSGEYIENIGHHNPRTEPSTDVLDEERALYWLSVGAQPSDAVSSIMRRTGTLERFERMRKGEALETLLQEAAAAKASAAPVSQKTRRPSPAAGQGRKAAAAAAEEAAS